MNYIDNIKTIEMPKNPVFHPKSKNFGLWLDLLDILFNRGNLGGISIYS